MTSRPRPWVLLFAFLLLATAPRAAVGQTTYVGEEPPDGVANDEETGWEGALSVGGNANVSSNQNVVGQNDGIGALLGLSLSGETRLRTGRHEWESSLTLDESFSQTPSLKTFVKNDDSLRLETIYHYYFVDWAGAFGLAGGETSLFPNNKVTAEATDYVLTRRDGSTDTFRDRRKFPMTGAFLPTSLDQSAGLFIKPIRREPITFVVRGGLGGRETFADRARVIDDDESTDVVEATELSDVFQGGVEMFAGVSGKFPDQNFTYRVGASGLLPIIDNDDRERSPVELFRFGTKAELTFQAFEWLSTSYNLEIVRAPQLVEATQISNNFLLNVSYTLIEAGNDDEEPDPGETLEEARQELEEAEQKVEELEREVEESDSEETDDEKGAGDEG